MRKNKPSARHSIGCTGWLLLLVLLLTVSNVATFLFTREAQAPAVFEGLYPLTDETPPADGLRDFAVINGHEHLYKREHLDAYLAAAKATGVEKTLFVASNEYTFLGKSGRKDALYDWSNQIVLDAYREMPDRIIPFASVYPGDPDKLQKLESYVAQGAQGLKLYSGHSTYYELPLDDEGMEPVLAYCERTRLPVCWHVNVTLYGPEFERVLKRHPALIVIVPHFGVTFYRPETDSFREMQRFLDTYPNLYVDCSFGTRDFLVHGLEMVSKYPEIFSKFFQTYQDRIIFGTDMVVTGNAQKTAEWYAAVIRACRDVLEKDRYHFFMAAEAHEDSYKPAHNVYGELRGLALPDAILAKVYRENLERVLAMRASP
jgi:predicted TIM-barrel fold metal-dependent hydrolase